MEKLRVHYDYEMESLTVWFDYPHNEYMSEEIGNGIVLMKNKDGQVIGFEKLYATLENGLTGLSLELIA